VPLADPMVIGDSTGCSRGIQLESQTRDRERPIRDSPVGRLEQPSQ